MTIDTKYVSGADKLARRIQTIRDRLSLPPMVAEIGDLLWKRTLKRFDDEVDPDGNPWTALKDSTLKRRSKDQKIKKLFQSGKLRASILIIKGGTGSTFTNTGAGVRIGIEASAKGARNQSVALYAGVHQRGNRHVEQRKFLGIGRLDVKAVDSFLRRKGQQALED